MSVAVTISAMAMVVGFIVCFGVPLRITESVRSGDHEGLAPHL
jgi:hypothetical protein